MYSGFALLTFLVGFITRPFDGAVFGHLGDRIGRKSTLVATLLLMSLSPFIIRFLPGYATIGRLIMLAFAFLYFMLMNTKSDAFVILAITISLALCHTWVYGPQATLIAERFGTRSRYSGASPGYQLAAPFAGGLAPIIALLVLNGKTKLAALGLSKVTAQLGRGSWQAVAI